MCSYLTVPTDISGSAKGAQGWFNVTSAQVYFDHPFHAPFDHTLNIDFTDSAKGPGARVAVELSAESSAPPRRQHHRGACRCRGRRLLTWPTGPAAGVHLPWARVPDAVKAWASSLGGGAPIEVRDLSGGFSPGAAARLECPRGAVFVKAVGADLNAESPLLHRREAVVSAALPASSAFPVLLDTYDDGAWVALAFEAIEGGLPQHPWERGELSAVLRALEEAHDALTPSPAAHLEAAALHFQPLFGGWAELAGSSAPPELDPWCADASAASRRARAALAHRNRGADPGPRGRSLGQHPYGSGGPRVRRLAARRRGRGRVRHRGLGALGRPGGRSPARRAPGRVPTLPECRP